MASSQFITHTCTGNAVRLSTILDPSGSARVYVGTVAVRASHTNTGNVYWGPSAVSGSNAGGYLEKGDAVAIDLTNKFFSSDDWYFVGTNNDVIYITVIS
jgi:hypothetical protein